MQPALIVYPDKPTLAEAVAQRTLLAILDDLGARPGRERLDIALTGGSDTIAALRDMAGNPLLRAIDWQRVHIWWADERFVAEDDSDRNALQARQALLDSLVQEGKLPEGNIHEMPADGLGGPAGLRRAQPADVGANSEPVQGLIKEGSETDALLESAAREYERDMIAELGDAPVFDLALLGMGPDGHYASLFPCHREIAVTERLAVGVSSSPAYVVPHGGRRQGRCAGPGVHGGE